MNLEPTKNDYSYATIKGGISAIPVAGGILSELLSLAIDSPLDKRKKQWIQNIERRLANLENISQYDLMGNEKWISLLQKANLIAITNHRKEKLEYLSNLLINSLLTQKTEEDKEFIFLNFIDIFTVSHITMLKFLYDPLSVLDKNILRKNLVEHQLLINNDGLDFLIDASPEWEPEDKSIKGYLLDLTKNNLLSTIFDGYSESDNDFYNQLINSLKINNLIFPSNIHSIIFVPKNQSFYGTTNLGKEFIEFIKN